MALCEVIRSRREELKLTNAEVASFAGLSIPEYRDVEQHEGEIHSVTTLKQLRGLANILKLDILAMFGIECPSCSESVDKANIYLPRNELIEAKRKAFNLTQEQLGDRIGFETATVKQMEHDPNFLEGWSVELIERLAQELEVPTQILLHISCVKCDS